MGMRERIVVVSVAVASVLVACGGSDDDDATSTTAPSASTEATATTAPPPATTAPATTEPATTAPPETTETSSTVPDSTAPEATQPPVGTPPPGTDAELAQWALLTIDEMPEGWTETPYEPSEDADDNDATAIIAECSGLDPILISDDVLGDTKAKSGEFASPDESATVQHSVGFAPDEETATASILALGDESLPDCYVEALTQRLNDVIAGADPATSMPPGVTITSVTVEPVSLSGILEEDEGVWYAGTIVLDYQGQPIESYVDLIWIRDGRSMTNLELGGDGAIFPDELIGPIASQAQAKLAAISEAAV